MFKTKKYEVTFYHTPPTKEVTYDRVTVCTLHKRKESHNGMRTNGLVSRGVAVQNGNFCKDVQRKTALTAAIEDLPREERAKIWKKYFKSKNGKQSNPRKNKKRKK